MKRPKIISILVGILLLFVVISNLSTTAFSPKIKRFVEIDDSSVSQSRCDVGSTQTVCFHAVWYSGGSVVEDGSIYVNGNEYTTNVTGWISFDVTSSTVTRKTWAVTGVNCDGIKRFFTTASDPSIIWDIVQVTLSLSDDRINVGYNASVTWNGIYEYDGSEFSGSISLNDTLTKNSVGRYGYTVVSIHDPAYGITIFEANTAQCVFDSVTISLSVGDDRIDVDSSADIAWTAHYQYDNTDYDGEISLNDTLKKSVVGRYDYSVSSISGDGYGITAFKSNAVSVVFDRVQITLSFSDDRINVGDTASLSITGVYEYDGSEYDGTVVLNDTLTSAVVGKNGYKVSAIDDSTHGLEVFSTNEVYCVFDKVDISLEVSRGVIDVGASADITWTAIHQYDGAEQEGTVTLNDTLVHLEPGSYGYTVKSISNTYGITVFDSNTVYVLFEGFLDEISPSAEAGPDQTAIVHSEVSFNASGSSDNIEIVSYEWDFGDGTKGTGLATTHIYTEVGTYTVTLTVKDGVGNNSTDILTVMVNVLFPWWILGVVLSLVSIIVGGFGAILVVYVRLKKPS